MSKHWVAAHRLELEGCIAGADLITGGAIQGYEAEIDHQPLGGVALQRHLRAHACIHQLLGALRELFLCLSTSLQTPLTIRVTSVFRCTMCTIVVLIRALHWVTKLGKR